MDMKKKQAPPAVLNDINVTPLVDVMLVMLIIFMVITPMLTKGQSVDKVKTANPIAMQDADKEDAVLVSVTKDGGVSNHGVLWMLMRELSQTNIDVIKTENLYLFDGEKGYSLGQGQ